MKCFFFFHVLSLFAYLGVPFKPGGFLDPESLVICNYTKVLVAMNTLKPIWLSPIDFSKLLSSRFYAQIVRPQMEYELTINLFSHSQLKRFGNIQNKCMQMIYGLRDHPSTNVMLHMVNFPTMIKRVWMVLFSPFFFT